MLGYTAELRQPLAKEAMPIFAVANVSIVSHERLGVGDGQMAVHPLQFLDVLVDIVSISTEDHASVAVFCDVFIDALEILTDLKAHSSVAATDECQDRWFVFLEGSASFFESPRSRPSFSLLPFSPTVT